MTRSDPDSGVSQGSPAPRSARLTVRQVVPETVDAVSLVFDRPADPRFTHRAGQFLTLRLPSGRTGSVARCYSLSSAPHDQELAVTVKRTPGGLGSNWVCDNLTPGDTIEVLPPSGTFVPASVDDDLLLVGAGSGITPLMSILRTALERGTASVILFYANRDQGSVIFADPLRELTARHPDRLTVIHWFSSVQGLPTAAGLRDLLEPYGGHDAFVCGPEPFMDTAHAALDEIGLPRDRIHTERFTSLSGDPFDEPEVDRASASRDEVDTSGLTVSLDGQTHSLGWPRSLSLVDLLVAHDIDVPYSCREGECGSCVCTLVDGSVEMARCDTLDPADVADGYILGCQSRPTSDHVVIEF
ncbi:MULTISPECIES: ferredoxin--NADP reductase [Arsenicicoccus]|uniref:ferredoxin--NADP reductase n=1 Tax=Arsenicicoccus TaxID=267408 RepID=UPI00257F5C8A|nr:MULTISPECIES: ferredoxin--NADP reductase [Arsenicicoccus]